MPTLSPDLIRAVLQAGDETPPPTGYEPTADDVRRAKERAAYAQALVSAVDGVPCVPLLAVRDAESTRGVVDTLDAARADLKARPDKSTDAIRLARILLIDAARILAGAADAVPV